MTLTLAPDTEARLRAAAAKKGLDPEEVTDALLQKDQDEQERLRAAFCKVQSAAQAMTFEPPPSNPDQAEEERLFGEIITEKYRKQGFNL